MNKIELLRLIRDSEVSYDDPWKVISDEGKDFIKKLLVKNPEKRMTAKQALLHPWISNNLTVSQIHKQ
jgi:serine/threonine protein kinase